MKFEIKNLIAAFLFVKNQRKKEQMQEEISERTIALGEKNTKFTFEMLEKMMREYINFTKNAVKKAIDKNKEKNIIPHGKMTIKELVKQNRGAQAMVIDDIGDWVTSNDS